MIHQRFISQRHLYQSPNPKSIALDLVDSGEMHYSNSSRHFDRCIGFTTAYVTPKVGGHYAAHQSTFGMTASDLYLKIIKQSLRMSLLTPTATMILRHQAG